MSYRILCPCYPGALELCSLNVLQNEKLGKADGKSEGKASDSLEETSSSMLFLLDSSGVNSNEAQSDVSQTTVCLLGPTITQLSTTASVSLQCCTRNSKNCVYHTTTFDIIHGYSDKYDTFAWLHTYFSLYVVQQVCPYLHICPHMHCVDSARYLNLCVSVQNSGPMVLHYAYR